MHSAKCPKCDNHILNVHFEAHNPSVLYGGGSGSYTATVFPCGHAIGGVPMSWETKLDSLQKGTKQLQDQINQIDRDLSRALNFLSEINRKVK